SIKEEKQASGTTLIHSQPHRLANSPGSKFNRHGGSILNRRQHGSGHEEWIAFRVYAIVRDATIRTVFFMGSFSVDDGNS
ncbi:hypothetical protein, partial [Delftia tsuruhatensis]|uniref:hypothetical protein n=1 Tax=Delftia tsuruhatensis TaxID=180282 RepID=UPI001CB9723D